MLQKQIIVNNACDFHAEVNTDQSNVKYLYVSEKKIQTQIPEMKIFFDTLKPLHGLIMAHSIRKTHCVNMCANTGNLLPYAQNINLISVETSKVSETHVSSVKVEKRCINWNRKILQRLIW